MSTSDSALALGEGNENSHKKYNFLCLFYEHRVFCENNEVGESKIKAAKENKF